MRQVVPSKTQSGKSEDTIKEMLDLTGKYNKMIQDTLYEEFTRLAETTLAQNTLNYLNIA